MNRHTTALYHVTTECMSCGYEDVVGVPIVNIPEVRALVEAVDLLLDTLPDTCMFDDDPSWDWAWNELSGDAQSRVKFARDEAIAALAPFEEQKK